VPQYLIVAYDGTDDGAFDRRARVRPMHFSALKTEVEAGHIRVAGAILDHHGAMIGSTIIAEYPDRAGLDAWLAIEPYVVHDVWRKIEITDFRIAVFDGKMTP
jgi:uncharacterized protein YciI